MDGFKMNKTMWIISGYILLILIILFFSISLSRANAKADYYKSNFTAQNDSLRHYKNKAGDAAATISMYKLTERDLKKTNKELYDALQKEKGEVKVIVTTKIQRVVDTIRVTVGTTEIVNDSTTKITAPYSNPNGSLSFNSEILLLTKDTIKLKEMIISNLTSGINLTIGIKDNKGVDEIFISSPDKGVSILELQGAEIVNKRIQTKSRWGIGAHVGFGGYYDPFHSTGGLGIVGSVGLNYNLIRFGGK